MKSTAEQLKAEFLLEAETLFDELMKWDESHEAPNLTEIEDVVLALRQKFGEQLVEKILKRQENRAPAKHIECGKCGAQMVPKGQKSNQITTRVGAFKVNRAHYYCPECQLGFFPPG